MSWSDDNEIMIEWNEDDGVRSKIALYYSDQVINI